MREHSWSRGRQNLRAVLREGVSHRTSIRFPEFQIVVFHTGHPRLPDSEMLVRGGIFVRDQAEKAFEQYIRTQCGSVH